MKSLPTFYSVIFLLLLGIGCQKSEKAITPEIDNLTESVYASVVIVPENQYEVYTNSQGIIEHIFVKEGDLVKKGQKLAKIRSDVAEANLKNARLSLDLAKDQLSGEGSVINELTLEIESTQSQLHVDSSNYFRQKSLWDQNIGSKTELESRKLKYDLTSQKLTTLRKRRAQKRDELNNKIEQSQNAVVSARSSFGDFEILSKSDGKVYEVLKETGELINPQQPLAIVGESDKFVIEMQIDEVDIVKINDSMKVVVTLDAYGDNTFMGRVSRIYPMKNTRTQTFKVEAEFTEPPGQLYAGLAGEANIVIREKDEVMTIPRSYVYDGNKVRTRDGESEVELGIQDLERVEVISGLDQSTELLKP